MKYHHIDPTFLLEGYNLFESNSYEQLVDKLVSIQGLINAGVEGEVHAATNMYGKILDRIRKEFGDLKAKQAEDAVHRRAYKKPEPKSTHKEPPRSSYGTSNNERKSTPKYKVGDNVVFVSFQNLITGRIMDVHIGSSINYDINHHSLQGTGKIKITKEPEFNILGKTRFKIGDTVLVGKVKSVVENFIQDNVYGFKIVLRDAMKTFRDEDLSPFREEPKSNPYDDEKEYANYRKQYEEKPKNEKQSSGNAANGEYYDPTSGWTFRIARFTDPYAGKRGSDKIVGYAYKNGKWFDFYGAFGGKQSGEPSSEFASKKRFNEKCSKKKDPYVPVVSIQKSTYDWLFQQAINW